jgi:hypothetical protein
MVQVVDDGSEMGKAVKDSSRAYWFSVSTAGRSLRDFVVECRSSEAAGLPRLEVPLVGSDLMATPLGK